MDVAGADVHGVVIGRGVTLSLGLALVVPWLDVKP